MIFFSVGLPSPLIDWCDAVIARLAQCVVGPADIVSANTLEELGLALIRSRAAHFVIGSRLPNDGLRRAIAENGSRFVVALDDPRAAFQNLVTRHGLDPITAAGIDVLILNLKRAYSMSMVVVTHELASAFLIADRIIVIDRGEIVAMGSTDEVRNSSHPRVRQFLDRSADADQDDEVDHLRMYTDGLK